MFAINIIIVVNIIIAMAIIPMTIVISISTTVGFQQLTPRPGRTRGAGKSAPRAELARAGMKNGSIRGWA